jgi:hypothetical protein
MKAVKPIAVALCLMFLLCSVLATPAGAYASMGEAGWQAPTELGPYRGNIVSTSIDVNDQGEALAVSVVRDTLVSTEYSMAVQYYLPSSGWVTLCDAGGAMFEIDWVNVAADGRGNFFVTNGYHRTPTQNDLFVRIFNYSGGWHSHCELQYAPGFTIADVNLVVSPNGNAMVVWEKQETSTSKIQILSRAYSPATGWSAEMVVRASSMVSPFYLTAGIGKDGSAAVAWGEFGGAAGIKCSRYTPGYEWTTIETLASGNPNGIAGVKFTGTSLLVVYLVSGFPAQIWGRTFSGSTWQPAVQIATVPEPMNPNLAVNNVGQALLVWGNDSWNSGVYYATYSAGAWSGPALAFGLTRDSSYLGRNGIHLADNGHALLAYEQAYAFGDSDGVVSRPFTPSVGFGDITRVTGNSVYSDPSSYGISGNGFMVMYWRMMVAEKMVEMAAVYTPAHLPGPSLTVSTPANGTTVTSATLLVTGHTDPGSKVFVSGKEAVVDSAGGFAITVTLTVGSNELTIWSTGPLGNTTATTRAVTYTSPTMVQMQNDINNLKSQGSLYLALGLIALIVAVVAIVLLFLRKKP